MGGDRGNQSKQARDAIELCPSDDQLLPRILVPEGLVTDFGRNTYSSIHQSYVSRQHCQLYWKSEAVLRVTPACKRAMAITTADEEVNILEPGGFPGEVRCPRLCCVAMRFVLKAQNL